MGQSRFNPETGQMEIIQSNDLSGLNLTSSNETQAQKVVLASKGLMKQKHNKSTKDYLKRVALPFYLEHKKMPFYYLDVIYKCK